MANMSDKDIINYVGGQKSQYNGNLSSKKAGQDYNISSCSYPSGVGSNPDLQHYITFFINVRGKSKFKYSSIGSVNSAPSSSMKDTTISNTGAAMGRGAALAFGGALLGGVAGATSATSKAGQGAKAMGAGAANGIFKAGAAGAATVGLVTAAVNLTSTLESDKKYRLTNVITLAVQERPSVSYGINYQDKDMGILGGFLSGDTSLSETTGGSKFGELSAAAALQIAKIPSLLPGFGSASLSDVIQFGAKVKTNPFREVFFEGIDYRKFNFKYKFMPKNDSEAQSVYDIIATFKEHMHPELSAGGYFYIYPSEFKIAYYYNNKENGYINRIADCALTDMTVDYGGEQFSSFDNGSPTEINLSLSFRELELLTKETIRTQGY
jgi:hypothetical protein